jgi:hypothetical protein
MAWPIEFPSLSDLCSYPLYDVLLKLKDVIQSLPDTSLHIKVHLYLFYWNSKKTKIYESILMWFERSILKKSYIFDKFIEIKKTNGKIWL